MTLDSSDAARALRAIPSDARRQASIENGRKNKKGSGGRPPGTHQSEETKQKIREAKRARDAARQKEKEAGEMTHYTATTDTGKYAQIPCDQATEEAMGVTQQEILDACRTQLRRWFGESWNTAQIYQGAKFIGTISNVKVYSTD